MLVPDLPESVELVKPESNVARAETPRNAAVIVAHPDDETLWCGGFILTHQNYNWFIASMCRKDDRDRSSKFFRALEIYGAKGAIGGLDDEPDQNPLPEDEIEKGILEIIPAIPFDLILTHGPRGEYTRHRRHEEVSRSVMQLWEAGAISTQELWLFAYDDSNGHTFPHADQAAHQHDRLPEEIWQEKYRLITEIYGFDPHSWEAYTTPKVEAFWQFTSPSALLEQIIG